LFLVLVRGGDNYGSGVVLAVIGTLKLFPFILLGLLVARRYWRALVSAVVISALLNLPLLLLSHVNVRSTLLALTSTAESWFGEQGNIGLVATIERTFGIVGLPATAIGVGLIGIALTLVFLRSEPTGAAVTVLLCTGIIALPVAWPHYVLAAVPAVILGSRDAEGSRTHKLAILVSILVTIPFAPTSLQTLGLAMLAVAFGAYLRPFSAPSAQPSPPIH
jgi:hypothetical protein